MGLARKTSVRPVRRRSGEMAVVVPPARESGIRLAGAPANDDVDALRSIAASMMAAAAGLDVCVRRARTKDVAACMAALAEDAKRLADDVAVQIPGGVRRLSTSERMRWEWLASTAALLDGGAERRLAEEAGRHIAIAVSAAAHLSDEELVRRVDRLAANSREAVAASA